jgi:hypothetical protein
MASNAILTIDGITTEMNEQTALNQCAQYEAQGYDFVKYQSNGVLRIDLHKNSVS